VFFRCRHCLPLPRLPVPSLFRASFVGGWLHCLATSEDENVASRDDTSLGIRGVGVLFGPQENIVPPRCYFPSAGSGVRPFPSSSPDCGFLSSFLAWIFFVNFAFLLVPALGDTSASRASTSGEPTGFAGRFSSL